MQKGWDWSLWLLMDLKPGGQITTTSAGRFGDKDTLSKLIKKLADWKEVGIYAS